MAAQRRIDLVLESVRRLLRMGATPNLINLLLKQAVREVMERQLEASRLAAALLRLRGSKALLMACERPTPFSFPLMVERLREKLSTEQIEQRVARMIAEIEGQSI